MNNLKQTLFKIASIIYVIAGVGHSSGGTFFNNLILKLSDHTIHASIQNVTVDILFFSINLADLIEGYHFSFGIMAFAFGMMNLLYSRHDMDKILDDKAIMILNITISLIMAILWYFYTFLLPAIEMTIATICFFLAFALPRSE